ncbi:spore cortex biosynthesis protein YabQ [Hominifimenecus sp. rT4P-3]|uniref:spore cortex biosynthesis protein YabQ n=1 Tax=Hominifimenecus sp. rT4P-3 TaxID=3242979 RepID=UPI003DA4B419
MFLVSILLGLELSFIYQVLLLVRGIVPHARWFRDVEDVIYWIFCSIQAFRLLFRENDGSIRWYFLAGIALGMIFCYEILGKPLKKFLLWVRMKRTTKDLGKYEKISKEKKQME